MEPRGFDDVSFRMLESPEPEPRRPRRPRRPARWLAAGAAVALMGGGLADAAPRQATKADGARPGVTQTKDGVPFMREGPECRAGEGKRRRRSGDASLRQH